MSPPSLQGEYLILGASPSSSSTDSPVPPNPLVSGEVDALEPIAIVGFSFRFPQDADSPASFWDLLLQARCASTDFPEDRLALSNYYHPDPDRSDTLPLRGGHFLRESIQAFDAPFFSISSSEAAGIDPQQRHLLETTYRAFENAGMPLEKVAGSRTSVFTGCMADDYRMLYSKDPQDRAPYAATGLAASILANRLSWFYNLTGTSMTIDTACSSSLVALDLACQNLINGESDMSVVAGCNLILAPDILHLLTGMNMLSRDSRCFSFDHRANGYARGEGFASIIVKRLSDAVRDGDTIRAVIRSTGTNQDGHTPGITQPSRDLQERLISDTYRKAGLQMGDTRYFEAHGTGTAVGDPIEANAFGTAFREYRDAQHPLYVGALKSNIGHLEGASGVAALIKIILVLEHGVIPPNSNFEMANPSIDEEHLRIRFPLSPIPWPTQGIRRASINSFGFGGTNAHAVIDDACHYLRLHNIVGNHATVPTPPSLAQVVQKLASSFPISSIDEDLVDQGDPDCLVSDEMVYRPRLLVWSSADREGIDRLAKIYSNYFSNLNLPLSEIEMFLDNLAYTLDSRRSSLQWKAYIVADSFSKLRGMAHEISKPIRSATELNLGFIFTGQGAQWARMGLELLDYPIFKESLGQCEKFLQEFGCPWLLVDELHIEKTTSKINLPDRSQPLCTALQIALVDLLDSFGVLPAAVLGHSSGEIAAAYCVGALSKRSAMKVAYYRGVFATSLAISGECKGAMISVALTESLCQPYLDRLTAEFGVQCVVVACFNSPKNLTISGDEIQIDALKEMLDAESIFARKLQVDVAYHSPHMSAVAADYRQALGFLKPRQFLAKPPLMISSVTGLPVSVQDLSQPDYWVQNLTCPVRFTQALGRLCAHPAAKARKKLDGSHRNQISINSLLEVGPHSALQGPVRDILHSIDNSSSISYYSVLTRHSSAVATTLDLIGRLHCAGYSVNISQVNRPESDRLMCLSDLPEYPFDHSKMHWHESRLSEESRFRRYPRLDLLGRPAWDWNPLEPYWVHSIKASEMPWIEDHKVNGMTLYPAAGMLVMAIEASNLLADPGRIISGFMLKDVNFRTALIIPEGDNGVETRLYLRPSRETSDKNSASFIFKLCTQKNSEWSEICLGIVVVEYTKALNEVDGGRELEEELKYHRLLDQNASQTCTTLVASDKLYDCLSKSGFQFGPAFQSLTDIQSGYEKARADVRVFEWPASNHPQPHIIHPTTLDGMIHLSLAAVTKGGSESSITMVPTQIKKLWLSAEGLSCPTTKMVRSTSHFTTISNRTIEVSVSALDKSGDNVRAYIEGLSMTTVTSSDSVAQEGAFETPKLCYNIEWKPDIEMLSNKQVLDLCEARRSFKPEPEPTLFFDDLNRLLLMFTAQTLQKLDQEPCEFSAPHVQTYVTWLRSQLSRYHEGKLPLGRPEWADSMLDATLLEELCTKLENQKLQGKFYVQTGRHLLSILRGDTNALDLFFKTGLLEEFYVEVNNTINSFHTFGVYLDNLAHKYPSMKILEVGAGTGGSTAMVLSALAMNGDSRLANPRYSQYDFTDISESFFGKSQEKFSSYSKLNFGALNIELDPIEQGFEGNSYDMIVAANVLHATKDLQRTLQNVRKLLKPGGKLVLFEATRPDILRIGFAMGPLDGWWLSTEDYRQSGPCLEVESWHEVLLKSGFSGTDLTFRDFESDVCHEADIIVSTAVSPSEDVQENVKAVIAVDHESASQKELGHQLREYLARHGVSDSNVRSIDELARSKEYHDAICIFLNEVEKPLLENLQVDDFTALQQVITGSKGSLWVSHDGEQSQSLVHKSLIDGLSRTLRVENGQRKIVTLALATQDASPEGLAEKICQAFVSSNFSYPGQGSEPAFVEMDDILHIGRVVEASQLSEDVSTGETERQTKPIGQCPALKLGLGTPGLLDTLHFVEDHDYSNPLAADEVEIRVHAVGLNLKDCLVVLGRVAGSYIGCECAGIVTRVGEMSQLNPGDRVVAFAPGSCKTYVRAQYQSVVKTPDALSFTDASSLPINFCTAWHTIHGIARLQEGESILIHSGAGGTGQASIQIAQYLKAEVFVTVSTEVKKKLMLDEYGIPEDHIFYSRDSSFAKGIKRMTAHRGVDVVLNSLAEEQLIASWECVAPYGRFIEIGKKDILSNSLLPMSVFEKNVTFSAVDVFTLAVERPDVCNRLMEKVVSLIESGSLHVVRPVQVYPITDVEKAFRTMQEGKNLGKTILEIEEGSLVSTILAKKPSFLFSATKTYVIVGGLGGLGRSIARYIVGRGVRNLILLSRSGPRTDTAKALLHELALDGVCVKAPACDVTDAEQLKALLDECALSMPQIGGCFQSAMILRDAIFENMSYEDWKVCTNPKVRGSWNLHTLLPKGMDFFVFLSSVSGVVGLGGQANYAAGNTYMDSLARYRVASGEKGCSLDLGAMSDQGLLAENEGLLNRVLAGGFLLPVTSKELFVLLDFYCNPELVLTQRNCQTLIGIETPANLKAKRLEASWANTPLFRHMHQIVPTAEVSAADTEEAVDFRTLFAEAAGLPSAGAVVSMALVKRLSRTLSAVQEGDVDMSKPLHTYGVDSLLAVELRSWLAGEFCADVPVFEILGGSSFTAVGISVARKSRYGQAAWME